MLGVIGGAAAVLAVLAGLTFAGIGPFATSPGTGTDSGGPTFTEAESGAIGAAGSHGQGPWYGWAGIGIDNPGPASVSLGFLTSSGFAASLFAGCTVSLQSATLTLPGFSGSLASGESPAWFVYLRNSSGSGVIVTDIGGSTRVLGSTSGAVCANDLAHTTPIGGGEVDSSVAASSAWAGGGAAFRAAHPGAGLTMTAVGGYSVGGVTESAAWTYTLSTCATSGGASSGPQVEFVAIVGMDSGRVEGTPATESITC